MASRGIPIHRGYHIEDLRTVELGWWPERGCRAAFIQLLGQEGVSEARVTEIGPGQTLPPLKLAIDELVYVLDGRGVTTVWPEEGRSHTFEWQARSLFLMHHGWRHQHASMQGDRPVRLLHYNYLPIAMSALRDPELFFNHPAVEPARIVDEPYAMARLAQGDGVPSVARGTFWYGDLFPDMGVWDNLVSTQRRGAGGKAVFLGFPGSEMSCHMSVFPSRTYKRAHRHGPGRVIVIPAGEGFSVFWQEGQEKIVAPWYEGSVIVPPNRWFHQHFNVGSTPARYLAFHPLRQFSGHSEKVQDRARDEIDYSQEEPWIREKFEAELAKRGLTSLMPEEAYRIPNFQWKEE